MGAYSIKPVDILTLIFLSFLMTTTVIFAENIPGWRLLMFIYLMLSIILISLIYFRGRNPALTFEIIHDILFPVIVVLLIFDSLGGIVHYINPRDIDPILIKIDYSIFGVHPTVWLERLSTPLLTDILHISYTTYYFLPIILGIILKLKKKHAEFDLTIFLILLGFYTSYIGYILFPALGPRFTIEHLHASEITGSGITQWIRQTLDSLEGIKRDAFPSGHTEIVLILLYIVWRFEKLLFYIYIPLIVMLMFSTVYCRYHYVIDVLAGGLLAVVCILIGPKLYNLLEFNKQRRI
ncbi:MAG: phosphatase PAP2 family protein [Nitrospirota bacterium]